MTITSNDNTSPYPNPPAAPALLVLPRLRVQNANAISSPLTWGFPAMSAFLGFMTALARKLGKESGINFLAVGVVCHDFEAQVTSAGYTKAFHLTRNPVLADGSTAGIVEEARAHLELTLVFDVELDSVNIGPAERYALAQSIAETVAGMRLAGGSVMPLLPNALRRSHKALKASLELLAEGKDERQKQFRSLARRCLPGFALVSRDDLLARRLGELQAVAPTASALDAWLDLSRWNHRCIDGKWVADKRQGWTVPIPVGYAGLSELHAPGAVAGARDGGTPFRFVETLWSMGQWVSPHRLQGLDDLLWYAQQEGACDAGDQPIYRCRNDYKPPSPMPDAAATGAPTVAANAV